MNCLITSPIDGLYSFQDLGYEIASLETGNNVIVESFHGAMKDKDFVSARKFLKERRENQKRINKLKIKIERGS